MSGPGGSLRRPDFVLAGAAKSGTTSLHHALARHPRIFMSSPLKEPRLFLPLEVARSYHRRRWGLEVESRRELLERWMLRGYAGEPCFGESTAEYTAGDTGREYAVAARMARANREMKLVYLVRHPLERIVSHRRHLGRRGLPRPDLRTLGSGADPHGEIVWRTSLYAWQLEPYLEVFGAERVRVVVLERLQADPARELGRIFRFLGVGEPPTGAIRLPHLNRAPADGSEEGAFHPETFGRLAGRLAREADALQPHVGTPLAEWDLSPERWLAPAPVPARAGPPDDPSTEGGNRTCGCT